MESASADRRSIPDPRHRLIRRVLCARGGRCRSGAQVAPWFNYGRQPHTLTEVEAEVVFTTPNSAAGLTATVPFGHDGRDVTAEFKLAEGEYEGGDVLDASVLLMPLVKFISPTGPKGLSTLDALNFPQALIHLALISAAFNLDRALDSPAASAGGWP